MNASTPLSPLQQMKPYSAAWIIGARDSMTVDARIIFRNALLLGVESIILVHNHPSDDPAD